MSKYYISHLFQENTGLSVHQYITKRRLSACADAMQSGQHINEIYTQLGFLNYSSFYRAFIKEYGCSPSVYLRGKTNGTDGNTYTISNLKIEEVTFATRVRPRRRTSSSSDTARLCRAAEQDARQGHPPHREDPRRGHGALEDQALRRDRRHLKAGQKYRISMIVKSIIPTPFEVCFNNGEEEKGLGAIFGLISKPSGQYVEYVTYAKQDTDLVIQLSLGNCAPPNSIILSGVKVEKAGAINLVSDTIYTF